MVPGVMTQFDEVSLLVGLEKYSVIASEIKK